MINVFEEVKAHEWLMKAYYNNPVVNRYVVINKDCCETSTDFYRGLAEVLYNSHAQVEQQIREILRMK